MLNTSFEFLENCLLCYNAQYFFFIFQGASIDKSVKTENSAIQNSVTQFKYTSKNNLYTLKSKWEIS